MLQFYYHPLSPFARRVWITLLEKQLNFEPIIVNLERGEQLKPKFLQLNPFRRIPLVVDGKFQIIESLAIMDYLEVKYPENPLLPGNPELLAKVKMAQSITNHELGSPVISLIFNDTDSIKIAKAKRKLNRICKFLSELLDEAAYFGGDRLSLGDIVAGNGLILINKLGFNFENFPKIDRYCQRLMKREAWQTTQPSSQQIEVWKTVARTLIKKNQS
ncbi:MAG: glutathione S-transferase family protein [Pleurocapsa sp.]